MKITYSLQEFRKQVVEIAKKTKESYVCVKVEMDGYEELTFSCYVNTYNWHSGKTVDECLNSLRQEILPTTLPEVDVEIEMEQVTDPANDISND